MITVADIRGNVEFFPLINALRKEHAPWRINFTDSKFFDIDLNTMESSDDIAFWDCELRNIRIVGSHLGEIKTLPGTSVDNLYMKNTRFNKFSFSDLVLTNSYINEFDFGINLHNNAFGRIDNCQFIGIKMFGGGKRIFGNIQNSKVSGKLHGVDFWENEDHTQCQNLDLSEALVSQSLFTGVDMRRIRCNPAWEHLIIEDWYQYKPALIEQAKQLLASSDKVDQVAGSVIIGDIKRDEKAYGSELDDKRGSAYIESVVSNALHKSTKERILEVYSFLGVSLLPK
ncbi:hypothetical protein [Corynebacterium durum]|uniref:hypothetical protein n=1 Tax=Corynebacterium durum TaxID=61592 RepID=UPI0028E96AD6|nr:hypothetical protein [Corynebacterium durum]